MAPLYLFLASSLNVELVYIILKGISKFAEVKTDRNGGSFAFEDERCSSYLSCDQENVRLEENGEDSTLVFDHIQIEDA